MQKQQHSKIIIGLDHGYGNIKTAHRVFKTGVECFEEEPIVSMNYVKYKDKYYVIGENHLIYQGNKTDSQDFFILTLAGLAEELKFRGLHEAKVVLAAGLPLAWAKSQAADFRKYLMQEQELSFSFRRENYRVHLCGVEVFPQGFAAVCSSGTMKGFNMIADIGNGTMNVMQIIDGKPIEKSLVTDKFGVSICMKEIRKELSKSSGEEIPEMLVEPLLRDGVQGRTDGMAATVQRIAAQYTDNILKRLADYGYKENLVHLYVAGGGGCLLRHYSDIASKGNVTFIEDICANAKGYEYLAAQKRKDRQKDNYLKEIENSGNGEKVFYENVVQIGKKTDTAVVDENGNLTKEAEAAIEVLEQYALTFQERNPNLYLFNCVLHLDEATPHLHIDYIPVAHGYQKGMETRNSLTKAFQQMGFAKAVSRKQNETVAWQERERAYLADLCAERGIEVETLGVKRENLSLPEYKAAMRKVEALEEQAEQIGSRNQELEAQTEELFQEIQKLEEKERDSRNILKQHTLRASELKLMEREADAETKAVKSAAVPVSSLFGGGEYVKVKKADWNKIVNVFHKAVKQNHLVEKYEKKIAGLEKRLDVLNGQMEKLKRFVESRGLGEAFAEYLKSLAPKTIKQKLKEAKAEAAEQNRQRADNIRRMPEKKKYQGQEL